MIKRSLIALLAVLGVAAVAAAEAPPTALLLACSACHGARGEGLAALGAPALAGQNADYLARQLRNFSLGQRGYAAQDHAGATMRGVAATLDAAAQTQLATYYGQLPAVTRVLAPAADLAQGQALYQQTCAACHGQQAQGYGQLHAPNLRLLDGRYIRLQLASYVQGWRSDETHGDIQGLWMRSIASHIRAPDELSAVIGYIERQ